MRGNNPISQLHLPRLPAPHPSNWALAGYLAAGRQDTSGLPLSSYSAQHDGALGTIVTNVILRLLRRAPCCMARPMGSEVPCCWVARAGRHLLAGTAPAGTTPTRPAGAACLSASSPQLQPFELGRGLFWTAPQALPTLAVTLPPLSPKTQPWRELLADGRNQQPQKNLARPTPCSPGVGGCKPFCYYTRGSAGPISHILALSLLGGPSEQP